MTLPSPVWLGLKLLACLLWSACQARGFSLCAYGEPAACALLGKRLVQIAVNLLERGGIEPVGEDGSPTDNVFSSGYFLRVALHHFLP